MAFWDPDIKIENFLRNIVKKTTVLEKQYIIGQRFIGQIVEFQRNFGKYGIRDTKFEENIQLIHIILQKNQSYD